MTVLVREGENGNPLLFLKGRMWYDADRGKEARRNIVQQLLEDIKSGQLKQAYLLYGEEAYLRLQYRDRLKNALADPADTMNFHRFEGKSIAPAELIDLAETMPFFAQRRVILVENSGFFQKSAEQLADYLKNPAPQLSSSSWRLRWIEEQDVQGGQGGRAGGRIRPSDGGNAEEVDSGADQKRGKKDFGRDPEQVLHHDRDGYGTYQQRAGETVLLYDGPGSHFPEDVNAVCIRQINSRIFEMVEAIALRRQQQALKLYSDLLALKEPPMRIRYLIARQFNLLLQVKALKKAGCDDRTIAEKTGLKSFLIRKYAAQASRFSGQELKEALTACVEADEAVKTGRMGDRMSVELLIIRYSREKERGRAWET